MKKRAQIIPFIRRNSGTHSRHRSQKLATDTEFIRGRPNAINDPASLAKDPADGDLAPANDLFVLMNDHCDVLLQATQALVRYLEDGSEKNASLLQDVCGRGDALKGRYLDLMETAHTTPVELHSIFRAVVTLDMAVFCTKTAASHILDMAQAADRFMLEMATNNRLCTNALQRGFLELTTNPPLAEQDALTVTRTRYNTEQLCRRALAELTEDDVMDKTRTVERERPAPGSDVFGILERREIYLDLARSAKRFSWAANNLREIASQLSALDPLTSESIQ